MSAPPLRPSTPKPKLRPPVPSRPQHLRKSSDVSIDRKTVVSYEWTPPSAPSPAVTDEPKTQQGLPPALPKRTNSSLLEGSVSAPLGFNNSADSPSSSKALSSQPKLLSQIPLPPPTKQQRALPSRSLPERLSRPLKHDQGRPPQPSVSAPSTQGNYAPPPKLNAVQTPLSSISRNQLNAAGSSRKAPSSMQSINLKNGVETIRFGSDFICVCTTSLRIYTSDMQLLKTIERTVSCAAQVGNLVWFGSPDGTVSCVNPWDELAPIEKGGQHTSKIVDIWMEERMALTYSLDGRLCAWSEADINSSPAYCKIPSGAVSAIYCSLKLWIVKQRSLHLYDVSNALSGTSAQLGQWSLRMDPSTRVPDFTCGCYDAFNEQVLFGMNDGTVMAHTLDLEPKYVIKVGIHTINSLSASGGKLWVGSRSGSVQALDLTCEPLRLFQQWNIGKEPVLLASSDGLLATISALKLELWDTRQVNQAVRDQSNLRDLSIMIFTWNVGACSAVGVDPGFLSDIMANQPDMVVIGLQEVVDLNDKSLTAKTIMGSGGGDDLEVFEKWSTILRTTLGTHYIPIKSRGMVGLYLIAFIKQNIKEAMSEVECISVKTGIGGLHGNKGGVLLRLKLFESTVCLVNCHLCAGHTSIMQRNKDAEMILEAEFANSYGRPMDHDYCFFFGDTNYRVNTAREQAIRIIKEKNWDKLYSHDQLARQIANNPTFVLGGFFEAPLQFPPTYKFDLGKDTYDTGDKKRIPAWTDRILYRGNVTVVEYSSFATYESDHRPVSAVLNIKL